MNRGLIVALLTTFACEKATPSTATTNVAILRAAIADWQEGPTDGRVCLIPRVLRLSADSAAPTLRWAPSVLNELLRDTLIAIDTTDAPTDSPEQRACGPTPHYPRIALGIPVLSGDSAVMSSASFLSDSVVFPEDERQWIVVLARTVYGWSIRSRPGMRFIDVDREPIPPSDDRPITRPPSKSPSH